MDAKIFKSKFSLEFNDTEIENEFIKTKVDNIKKLGRLTTLLFFILNLITTIILSCLPFDYKSERELLVLFSSYTSTFLYFILVLMSLFYHNNETVLKYVLYAVYILSWFSFGNFTFSMNAFTKIDVVLIYSILPFELTVRLLFVIFNLQTFNENLILNLIVFLISILTRLTPKIQVEVLIIDVQRILGYCFFLLLLCLISYFMARENRNTFYYQNNLVRESKWLKNILENMNTGFLSIKQNKILYLNSFLIRRFENLSDVKLINDESNNSADLSIQKHKKSDFLNEHSNHILFDQIRSQEFYNKFHSGKFLKLIFKDIITDSITDENVKIIINDFNTQINNNDNFSKNFINLFKEHLSNITEIYNSTYIGNIILKEEESENSYEVFCRLKDDQLDFLFNDVTRTKLREKINAEFKYKTTFLAKVAHEFKNPLVCITELVNQMKECQHVRNLKIIEHPNCINGCNPRKIGNTINQIKSMSDYLLVMVEDLDYFAQYQLGRQKVSDKKEVLLEEIIIYCEELVNSLLTKNNKNDSVKFRVDKEDNVPDYILIDEWNLKQILVNLLSNSVKFTMYGEIVLEIKNDLEGNKIEFLIRDTGIGIKEEIMKILLKPFGKEYNSIDNFESGLGLSIANQLSLELGGSNIQFKSEYQRGSSFWFTICNKHPTTKKSMLDLNKVRKSTFDIHNIIVIEANESTDTIKTDCFPKKIEIEPEIILKIKNPTHNYKNKCISVHSEPEKMDNIRCFKYKLTDLFKDDLSILRNPCNNFMNILIVDDESFIRMSTFRLLTEMAKEKNILINVIEAEDGVEALYIVYKCISKGIKISSILSDENMVFMKGTRSSELIKELLGYKHLSTIPFYLVTAYDVEYMERYTIPFVQNVLPKPLSKKSLKNVLGLE